ncbi:hypothetical protein [Acetobacterium bakii]|uniref:hypothetical protein n=1 Tax=Acetobacterium bakii TaxID=52689 RepID=UPI001364C9A8|nr:hypothetical protein [Acetobacterium bakii]
MSKNKVTNLANDKGKIGHFVFLKAKIFPAGFFKESTINKIIQLIVNHQSDVFL